MGCPFEAAEVEKFIVAELTEVADRAAAPAMARYMKDQFAFLGVPAPKRKLATRRALVGIGRPNQSDLEQLAARLWVRREREYQYVASDLFQQYVSRCDASLLPTLRTVIVAKPWWDTVDSLATRAVGPLVLAHDELRQVMDEWIASENLWLRRTALLHQLHWATDTDESRLFRYCLAQADDTDFFIRKAIGWALRHYARTAPDAVRRFVAANQDRLSTLSKREATKHL